MAMKPSQIFDVMDLALRAREKGHVFNPLFVGPPGIGKSQIIQQWCKEKDLPFIDLRIALMEAPDMIGFPTVEKIKGRQVTSHNLPDFWPSEGRGVLLLEEPNRGTTSVMNTLMQLLTDRKIHQYSLPEGWLIASAINPEDAQYDVNTMDAALRDRFEVFEVGYDKQSFVDHMKAAKWNSNVRMFVEANLWEYKLPENIKSPGAKYNSPRTFSKLNAAEEAGLDMNFADVVYNSILGRDVGAAYYAFRTNETPVLFSDIESNPKAALKRIRYFSDPNNYKSGHVNITVSSIVEDGSIEDAVLADVFLALPADQGTKLIRDLEFKRGEKDLMTRLANNYPEVKKFLKAVLKVK